jgi:hypothetical protein
MQKLIVDVKNSFLAALRGEESLSKVTWYWGIPICFFAYFVADKLVKFVNLYVVDILISILMIAAFAFHIYVIRKCSPAKPKLTPEEKKSAKEKRKKEMFRKFMRKLFLKEPMTEWNSAIVFTAIDLLGIVCFASYLFH